MPNFGEFSPAKEIENRRSSIYGSYMKSATIPLAMPKDLLAEVRQAARKTGLSMADTMRQSMKLGLDKLVRELGSHRRVTNVDPLPDSALDRIYSRPERDERGLERWTKAQAIGGRD